MFWVSVSKRDYIKRVLMKKFHSFGNFRKLFLLVSLFTANIQAFLVKLRLILTNIMSYRASVKNTIRVWGTAVEISPEKAYKVKRGVQELGDELGFCVLNLLPEVSNLSSLWPWILCKVKEFFICPVTSHWSMVRAYHGKSSSCHVWWPFV